MPRFSLKTIALAVTLAALALGIPAAHRSGHEAGRIAGYGAGYDDARLKFEPGEIRGGTLSLGPGDSVVLATGQGCAIQEFEIVVKDEPGIHLADSCLIARGNQSVLQFRNGRLDGVSACIAVASEDDEIRVSDSYVELDQTN